MQTSTSATRMERRYSSKLYRISVGLAPISSSTRERGMDPGIQASYSRSRCARCLLCSRCNECDILARIEAIERHGNSSRRCHSRVSASGVSSLALRICMHSGQLVSWLLCYHLHSSINSWSLGQARHESILEVSPHNVLLQSHKLRKLWLTS